MLLYKLVPCCFVHGKFLFLILMLGDLFEIEAHYNCQAPGKVKDPEDKHGYHQCVALHGQLIYLYNTCPGETCFSEELQHCTRQACLSKIEFQFSSFPSHIRTFRDVGSSKYSCKGHKAHCQKRGLYGHSNDHSIYFKCVKLWGEWKTLCFTCNKKHKTCFSESHQACIPNDGKSCGKGSTPNNLIPNPTTYDCDGYSQFPCKILKAGTHGMPGDKSVYWTCTKPTNGKFVGDCHTCPKETESLFIETKDICVPNRGLGELHKPYNCETYKGWENFQCRDTGFFANPYDTSVFFNCEEGYEAECFTCNRVKKTCFSDQFQACVAYKGGQCPMLEIIDGPDDNGAVGDPEVSLSYDCSGYNEYSIPCDIYEVGGQYEHPGDRSVYFECVKQGQSKSGRAKWIAKCTSCDEETNSCYDAEKEHRHCLKFCGRTSHKPYDCSTYNENLIPCRESGYLANPSDTSIYFGCSFPEEGGTRALCYTCNKKKRTCFDDQEMRCVSNDGRDECGTKDQLEGNEGRGDGISSLTYSCSGYSKTSFPCHAFQAGLYALPGDPSVYVKCGPVSKNKVDKSAHQSLSKYESCSACSKQEKECFDNEERKCVQNCWGEDSGSEEISSTSELPSTTTEGSGETTTTPFETSTTLPPSTTTELYEPTKPPPTEPPIKVNGTIRPYNCSGYNELSYPCEHEGLFPHPLDPTVFFQCEMDASRQILMNLCYTCNTVLRSCFSKEKGRCVAGCDQNGEWNTEEPDSTGQTYGDNCVGYGMGAIPCSYLLYLMFMKAHSEAQDLQSILLKTAAHLHAHVGDPAVYFRCVEVGTKWLPFCHLCPISTCFDEDKQICTTEGCSEYQPSPGTELAPYQPYDCRYYPHYDSYPCTERGSFVNPIDTSIYFDCVKVGAKLEAMCYTCNKKLKTCFSQGNGACITSASEMDCGTYHAPSSIGNHTMGYDCDGYDPDASLPPCNLLGMGVHGMPGDHSVYWTCSGLEGRGQCKTCDKAMSTCFDNGKKRCVQECESQFTKPYDCSLYIYSNKNPFHCPREGYFAHKLESSIYFKCVKKGKKYWVECYSCNNMKQTCFSNKLQACLTKGGMPCGHADPTDSVVGGTEAISRAYSCEGYDFSNFPCFVYGVGTYSIKGDRSVYVSCNMSFGQYVAECKSCDGLTKSCFDERTKTCQENCGRGPIKPYNCSAYDDLSYKCIKEGLFANPSDTSIFFWCVKVSGHPGWKAYCYTCNSVIGTCFNEKSKTCIKNNRKPCGPLIEDGEGEIDPYDSLTYNCTGYNKLSFPCAQYAGGTHVMPADKSVYFNCTIKGGKFIAVCHSCPKNDFKCYVESERKCVELCGRGPLQKYDCEGPHSFRCLKTGIFAGPNDTSIFFKCVKKNGKLEAQCFTCSSEFKTCFSNKEQTCLTFGGRACDKSDPANHKDSGTPKTSRTYSCLGYGSTAFPCSKYPPGKWLETLADPSVYFMCGNDHTVECKACDGENRACFIPQLDKCVDNCGKGSHISYSCDTYEEDDFPCTKAGYFPNPKDTSIFFRCVKIKGNWEAHCCTCSSSKKTCFSRDQNACVTNSGKPCGSLDPYVDDPQFGGTEETSRTYDCSGYKNWTFPCSKFPEGDYVHPGDKSVYFECTKNGRKYEAKCQTCSGTSCFSQKYELCVANCNHGSHHPYHCKSYGYKDYPCSREGGYFGNPKDSSVYFSCRKDRGIMKAYCYACNEIRMTCFSNQLQACVNTRNKATGKNGCGKIENRDVIGTEVSARSYNCDGYSESAYPCQNVAQEGVRFALPGDKSVYMECIRGTKPGTWVAKCKPCPRSTASCFIEKRKECVKNCGIGRGLILTQGRSSAISHRFKLRLQMHGRRHLPYGNMSNVVGSNVSYLNTSYY